MLSARQALPVAVAVLVVPVGRGGHGSDFHLSIRQSRDPAPALVVLTVLVRPCPYLYGSWWR